jgi:hypothetical protein
MKNLFSMLAMGTFIFFSCETENKTSDKISSNDIYQKYEITCKEGGSVFANAEFRVEAYWDRMETEKTGGFSVKLMNPSIVKLNGTAMKEDKSVFTGIYYSLQIDPPVDGVYKWEWTDNQGKIFTNSFTLRPIRIKGFPVADYRNDCVISWEGAPVGPDETVLVTMEGYINNKKDNINQRTSTPGATSVTFTPEQLKLMQGQNVNVVVSRRIKTRIKEASAAEGNADLKYESNSQTMTIMGDNGKVIY